MSGVADTVQLSISLDAPVITSLGLGRICLAGVNAQFTERFRLYSSAAELLADAEAQISSADWEYVAMNAIFSQPRVPSDVMVGRVDNSSFVAQDILFTVNDPPSDGVFSVKINGIEVATFTASSSTDDAVVADLVSDINGSNENVTATDNLNGTFNVVSDTAGDGFTYEASAPNDELTTSVAVANHGWAEELDLIAAAEDDFFYVCTSDRTDAVIEDVAAWCEGLTPIKRIYLAQSDETNIGVAATTDDVMSKLKAQTYDYTGLLFYGDDTVAAVEAWAGRKGSVNPDVKSPSWVHAQLAGITYEKLSTTIQAAAEAKNANMYLKYAGVGATWEGKVASGRYIDVIISKEWLRNRMTEDLQQFFLNKSARDEKVPYTNEGFRELVAVMRNRLSIGQDIGHVDPEVEPRFQIPDRATIPQTTVDAREVTIPWQAQVGSGIHKVIVEGDFTTVLPT